jgi:hypothetical protein
MSLNKHITATKFPFISLLVKPVDNAGHVISWATTGNIMRHILMAIGALSAVAMAAPAAASINVPVSGASNTCDTAPADTTPAAIKCVGYFDGQVLDQADSATIGTALSALGVSYSGQLSDYLTLTGLTGSVDLTAFGTLTGIQTIGIHFGNAIGQDNFLGNVTAFYQIDFGSTGSILHLNVPGSSSATLFTSTAAVPEPATWALMLLGFGGIGMSMRRGRRHSKQALMQIA